VHGFAGYAEGARLPTLPQILEGEPPANNEPIRVMRIPGTIWQYSGGGYVIVQQVLEDATSQNFPRFMHDTVLAPFGMTRSTYEQPLPHGKFANVAMPYDEVGMPERGGTHVYPEMTAAGLWTTAPDLARFLIGIQNALAGTDDRVLNTGMAAEMVRHGGLGNFGLGLHLSDDTGHPYFDHGGANNGFQSYMLAYNSGDGIVMMSNSDNGQQLEGEILRTVAHEYHWPDFQPRTIKPVVVSSKKMDEISGYYERTADTVFHVFREGKELFAQSTGNPRFRLVPVSNNEWYRIDPEAKLTFDRDVSGGVTQIEISQGDQNFAEKRLDNAKARAIERRAHMR
jgi:CubicO group peptidase (beta-lactamase class C family)